MNKYTAIQRKLITCASILGSFLLHMENSILSIMLKSETVSSMNCRGIRVCSVNWVIPLPSTTSHPQFDYPHIFIN